MPRPTRTKVCSNVETSKTLLEVERELIRKALAEANGSVTHAAPLLGITYPGLIYIIQRRHPDLLKERTPVRHRRKK